MTNMLTSNKFTSGGKIIQSELFNPSETPNGGVIIIAFGTHGMLEPWGSEIRAYADALSQKGFVAIIPDYFVSTNTTPGLEAFQEISIHRDTWQETIADAVAHVSAFPSIDASRVGLLGFSLGGHICLRLREIAKVLVEFFAPELDGLGPTKKLILQTQIHHGLADKLVPFHPNAENINNILEKEGDISELFSYHDANHGFIGNDLDNTDARKISMARTISFFEKYL
jgi:dienelactone hydrolase